MKLILSLFSRKTSKGQDCAKNYPFTEGLVRLLKGQDHYLIQIGSEGEDDLNCHKKLFNLKFSALKGLLNDVDGFIGIDNFFPHFVNHYDKTKSGIVIWSKSDPLVFGYGSNINLLKDKKYLRKNQFSYWDDEKLEPDSFVEPDIILNALNELKGFKCQ